ncbi:ABC transporter ATP-binding protein/permease [Kaistia dalseonensis]|uniref:ATP-binding cassette transporter n=1 Tax=Kaistia dalseonensis TaxID=410840 RepID=A0ABU0H509_9HYPH|nr:ABC transporter ATP-binding protein/permease [Kaistia dalseonensis]MCX5494812.1 ABC transporter ATP-binding protein/permease [Kaistia dalseonensis]MDQ0437393.1 putative ATP-binding cassette transporter [Kaistia dalseonensis]
MTERPDDSTGEAPELDMRGEIEELIRQFTAFMSALWHSSGRSTFVLLSVGMVTVIIATSGMQIVLNAWNKPFYDAIEQKNVPSFLFYLMVFGGIAGVLLALNVAQTWLDQMIKLQSRKWLTRDLISQWLKPRRLVLLRDAGDIGINPDQRVHEDARHLAELTAGLGIGLLQSSLLLVSFITVLWSLSSGIALVIDGMSIVIPGYMVWCALIYAATGSWVSWRVGRPLINIGVERYAREADMRFALVQVSENANGIVLNAGEADERGRLNEELERLLAVMRRLVDSIARLTWVTAGYGWVGIVAPIVIAAPGYFGGQLSFGQLMMVVGAFNQVQNSLRWFVDNFSAIADWRATLSRVMSFREALTSLEDQRNGAGRIAYEPDPMDGLSLRDVSVRWTDNRARLDQPEIDILPGDRMLIVDRTGSGRGALFSALAGLWPWGSGTILLPARSKAMFLPERPYVPDGPLRAALTYPTSGSGLSDGDLGAALDRVGLSRLKPSLDRKSRWGRELSSDDEERLTFARLLLLKPQWIFSEQSIDTLDDEQRAIFRSILETDLAKSALVTVSARPSAGDFYNRTANLVLVEPAEPEHIADDTAAAIETAPGTPS